MGRLGQVMADPSQANKTGAEKESEETIARRSLSSIPRAPEGNLNTQRVPHHPPPPNPADDASFNWRVFSQNPPYPSSQLAYQPPMVYQTGFVPHPPPPSFSFPGRTMSVDVQPQQPRVTDYRSRDRSYLLLPSRVDTTTVPNIVIEHVSTVLQSRTDSCTHTLTPPFSSSPSRWSSGPSDHKIRAYSDSAVYEMDRNYPALTPPETRQLNVFHFDRPTTYSPMSSSDHPEGSDDERISEETNDYQIRDTSETAVEDLRQSFLSRTKAAFTEQLRTDSTSWLHSDSARISTCVGGLGSESSPKTYWLRRHSDSNVTNEEEEMNRREESSPVKSLGVSDPAVDSGDTLHHEEKGTIEKLSADAVTSPQDSERLQTVEKSKCLMQKRQKLKKYLQARYQSGLDQQAASSTDTDEVFVDKSLDDPHRDPTDLSPSSRVSTDLSPSSRVTSEISPSTSLEMTRLDEDAVFMYRSSEPLVGEYRSSEPQIGVYRSSEPVVGEYATRQSGFGASGRSVEHFSSSEELPVSEPERRPKMSSAGDQRSMSTICEQPLFRNTAKRETPIFTFPTLSLDAFTQNLYHQSFPAVSPFGHHSPIGSGSTQLIPSPLVIRKYGGSLGSTVQPTPAMLQHRVGGIGSAAAEVRSSMAAAARALTYPGEGHYGKDIDIASKYAGSSFPVTLLAFETDRRHQLQTNHNVRSSALSTSAPPSPVAPHIPCSPSYSHMLHPADVMMTVEGQLESVDQGQTVFYPFSKKIPKQQHRGGEDSATGAMTSSTFSCPVCNLSFSSYNLLANHMIAHLPTEVISVASSAGAPEGSHVHLCKVCNRSFSRSDMLSRHMRLHTGLRPYECDLCGQVFSRSDHLHTHQRTHTGEKPYHCVHCVYAAPRRDMVTRHMRVHSRDTPSCRGRRSHSASSYPSDNPIVVGGGEDIVHSRTSSSSSSSRGGRGRKYKGELPGSRRSSGSQQQERSRIWSLTSSAASTEGSEPSPGVILTPKEGSARGRGTVSRTWSVTSAESSEMFSSPGYATPSAVWSPPVTDSPDVFSSSARHPKHFVWPAVAMTTDQGEDVPSTGNKSDELPTAEQSRDELMMVTRSELQ